jgi:tRNA(Arg) A34 adenosine deaminase TadA
VANFGRFEYGLRPRGIDMSMVSAEQHCQRMRSLVEFTRSSFDSGFPYPFGSAIYDLESGELLAQAYDTVMKDVDPTNHGEMNAIRKASRNAQRLSLRGSILYSTCEPCPMCMSACIWAEVDTVVYGASTMEDAHQYWPQASDLLPSELVSRMLMEPICNVIAGVERSRCQDLFTHCEQLQRQRRLRLPPNR